MKIRFKAPELEHFYLTPLGEIKGKLKFQKDIIKQFKKKIQVLKSISSLEELKLYKGLHFEPLKGDKAGDYSIRLNIQYRLIFSIIETASGDVVIEALLIKEISKHYEK